MGAATRLFAPEEIGWLLVEADALMARTGARGSLADPHRHAEVFARLGGDPRLCMAAARLAGGGNRLVANALGLVASSLVRADALPPGPREGMLHAAVALGGDPRAAVGAAAFASRRREALARLDAPGMRFVASFSPGAPRRPLAKAGGLWPPAFVCAG